MTRLLLILNTLIMSGCSLFGDNGVKDAPYSVVDSAANGVRSCILHTDGGGFNDRYSLASVISKFSELFCLVNKYKKQLQKQLIGDLKYSFTNE